MAVSDPMGVIARPLDTLIIDSMGQAVEKIGDLIVEYEPVGVVVGNPISMSGDESELSLLVDEFVELLKDTTDVPVTYEDERLSSVQAKQVLHSHGKKIKGNKEIIDRIAAAIVLQSFLDRNSGV